MSKCENCIHRGACQSQAEIYERPECDFYLDRTLFVELPCRCKDCKHSKQPYIEYDDVFECHADTHYTGIRLVEADDFCKYAELKEMGV